MAVKPANEALLKLLARGADCTAVICVGHFPQSNSCVIGCDPAGMANRDVAIISAVDQQNRHCSCGYYPSRRKLLQVQIVLPPGIAKCNLDNRTQRSPPQPRARAKKLPDAIIGNLTKARKGRLRCNSTEVRFGLQRLQQLRRTHGFRESEDATRMLILFEPIKPAANI